MKQIRIAILALTCVISVTPLSTASADQHAPEAGAVASSVALTDGEIRKVDKDAQKITIRHGPIENLGMPAMTMVFRVKDPAMFDQVKVSDKIKFTADKVGGALTVTHIEPIK